MIKSHHVSQMRVSHQVLNSDNDPQTWTDSDLARIFKGEVLIGYFLRVKRSKLNEYVTLATLYTIKPNYLYSLTSVIPIKRFITTYAEWSVSAKTIAFENPPIKEWMDTKENWAKHLANRLSEQYSDYTYDECLSNVYLSIMKCYNRKTIYMGNLSYLEIAARNEIKLAYRFERNRITQDHGNAESLDAILPGSDQDGDITLHDVIGKDDPEHEEQDRAEYLAELKDALTGDLSEVFTVREIDQLFTQEIVGFIPKSIMRKLRKWRETHRRSDYV